jgi:hypothetical protein
MIAIGFACTAVVSFGLGMWLEHRRDVIKPRHEARLRELLESLERKVDDLRRR